MVEATVVSQEQWLNARKALLEREKAFTRERDALSAARREMPATRITKDYRFETESGPKSLTELFEGQKQLVIYHFMYGPEWEQGCVSCTFWADSFDRTVPHLRARDTAFACTSNAPLATLLAYRDRFGWSFPWVSTAGNGFSEDFGVTFHEDRPSPLGYNYSGKPWGDEAPGLSVFARLEDGGIAHTYSTYGRGLDAMNSAYQLLDMTPLGRHEEGLDWPMAWLRRRDEYA